MFSIPHTIRLQDGSLCNLTKRMAKQGTSLVALIRAEVTDPRRPQGTRHPVVLILLIVFIGLLTGSKDLKDACLFARYNHRLFARLLGVPLRHNIPDPTTVSRVFQKLDTEELVTVGVQFLGVIGIPLADVYSFDGKTMRAVPGEEAIRHMLSLFAHGSHVALGQIGVGSKENEIPALERLLAQGQNLHLIAGKLLIGDALHTQKATCKLILKHQADYLFTVKNNQRKLKRTIATTIATADQAALSTATTIDNGRGRHITTTVTLMTLSNMNSSATGSDLGSNHQDLLPGLKGSNHWDGVQTIGILHRTGTRTGKDGTVHQVDETIGFIGSRELTAEEAGTHLHHHWCIENNLHWVKDEVFGEDKHTLRKKHAPQVMSWLRSLVVSLCNALKLKSISDAVHNLQKSTKLLARFLEMGGVV